MESTPSSNPEEQPDRKRKYGKPLLISIALALQVVAALCYPIAKYGLEIIEPYTYAFYRFVISSVVLLTFVLVQKHAVPVARKDYGKIILLGFLIIPFNQTGFLVGQSMTAAGHGAFLFASTPAFIFALAIIHRQESLVWRRVAGIVLAMVGAMTIILSGAISFGTEYLIGDLIILVSVIAWGYYTVLGRDLVRKYGALRITAYALSSGSAMYLPFGLYMALRYDYSQATLAAWGSVFYMAILMSTGVYVVWYWLLKSMDASRLAVYHNIQPVIASAAAYVLLGERITIAFVAGGAVVLFGVIISEFSSKRKMPVELSAPNRR